MRPVEKIEVSDKNRKLRMVLIVVLLAIGVVAIGTGLMALLGTEPGWTTVEVSSSELHCGDDFTLQYCFGQTSMDAAAENKQLNMLYSQAAVDAYRIFGQDVAELSTQVNQAVSVDPGLYKALTQISQSGNRCVFLAPVYMEYDRIFRSESDAEAQSYTPSRNADLAQYVQDVAAFARDPEQIRLELLGDNQVRLYVSEAYLSFAQAQEIDNFVDVGWMKNAFIADYIADILTQKGFTNGFIASEDGFTRNLNASAQTFSFNIFDRLEDQIYLPAVLQYDTPLSIVFLRNYPMSQRDSDSYYAFGDGLIVTDQIDPADGMSKSATDNLVCYSETAGCARIALEAAPVYLAESLDTQALAQLKADGIYSIWFENSVLYANQPGAVLGLLETEGATYTTKYVE